MPEPIRLIHPIYLDVPMLVSFAAAIEGGLSFGAEVTREKSHSAGTEASIGGKLGLSSLFSRFLDASVEGRLARGSESQERSVEQESKSHTEASVVILLYDRLRRDGGYIIDPKSLQDVTAVEPGALVEVAGTVEKNAVDQVIDTIDAVDILSRMASPEQPPQARAAGGKAKRRSSSKDEASPLRNIRVSLDSDRKRTPISNVLLRCSVPEGATAIVTLRTANLRDLTLSELHKNSVRVLGKVTRVIPPEASVSPFENYGMSLLKPAKLREVFDILEANEDMAAEFSEVEIHGPAVQVLPLMVFV
jgi:hypothetical protein